MTGEASRILSHLASMPQYGNASATYAQVREIMLQTGGEMMAAGDMYEIKSKALGGGVYRLTLKRKEYR